MTQQTKAFLQLHLAIFIVSFTAILGDLITLSALYLVWWRVVFTTISFLFIINIKNKLKLLGLKKTLLFIFIGFFVFLHWFCFYGSIKLSNASIGLVGLSSTSFFTALLQPYFLDKKFSATEGWLGLWMIVGIVFIVEDLQLGMVLGLGVGLLSALFSSIFSILNKKYIHLTDANTINFLEVIGVLICCTLILPFYFVYFPNERFLPNLSDTIYLIILALVCTTFAYLLILKSLRYISVFVSNLSFNLEPIYGLLLAILILKEHKDLSLTFYIGALIILSAVILYPLLKNESKLK